MWGDGGGHAVGIRVSAPAVDGQATAAALAAVATAFGVRRHAVTLVAGASSRTKIIDVAGADPAAHGRLTGTVTSAGSLARLDDRHRRECHLYADVLASHRHKASSADGTRMHCCKAASIPHAWQSSTRPGIYLAGPLERFALLYGQDRDEPYEPHGACLVEFGDGIP